ncbi:pleiotropic regulatory protein RsmS [Vibrio palustris]|uniref:Primosomal protein n=1 Tax=Vibrio palustris TaxID=1918946 RepID=A0A1R4B1Y7_9VIBR|nr:pleiotropic regulatory protein RsmS [Vibrio palustris]SJL82897.1 hypothetical protein VPAL9027_00838 [Vibrio palustris]
MSDSSSPLDQAPDDIKLAVDLIYLFESNEVDPHTALAALEVVKRDLQAKVTAQANSKPQ